jgi:hypothetical protein
MDRKFSKKEKKNPIRHKTKSRKPIRLKTKSRKSIRLKTKSRRRKIGGDKNAYKQVENEVKAIASVFYKRPRNKENFIRVLKMLEKLTTRRHNSCGDLYNYSVSCGEKKEIQYYVALVLAREMMTANINRTEGDKLFNDSEVTILNNTITKLGGQYVDYINYHISGKINRLESLGIIKTLNDPSLNYEENYSELENAFMWSEERILRSKEYLLYMEILELIKSNPDYYMEGYIPNKKMASVLKNITKEERSDHIESPDIYKNESGEPFVELGLQRIVLDSLETKNITLEKKPEYSIELHKNYIGKYDEFREKLEKNPLGFWREEVMKGKNVYRTYNGYLFVRSAYNDAVREYLKIRQDQE